MSVESRYTGSLPQADPATMINEIPSDATLLISGFGSVGYPKAVPLAIADSDREFSLAVISGGSAGEEVDKALVEKNALDRRFPYQAQPELRKAVNNHDVAYHDRNVSTVGDEVRYGGLINSKPTIAVVEAIAVGEDWLIPSTSIGQTPAFVEAADRVIVEVNNTQPLGLQEIHDVYRQKAPPNREPIPLTDPCGRIGESRIRFDSKKLLGVVETDQADSPYSFRDPTADDQKIAKNFGQFLLKEMRRSLVYDDSLQLQFGVGSLGNALMGELADIEYGERDVVYYGEVIQDGLLDMLDENLLKGASATSLALSEDGQQRLFANIERYAEDIILRPSDISNSPTLIDRFGVIAVNSAIEIDIYGHVNSTHVNGTRVINGVGGSGDFNRNAMVTVCTLPSTAVNGDLSRIVPMTFHVDHTEHDTDIIVTEQGVADLRGLSPIERANRIIEQCAHPSFRDDLREYFTQAQDENGHIPHNIERAASWRSG